MRLVSLELESKLREKGLWPETRMARAGVYVVVLDLLFFVVQMLTSRLSPSVSASLGGWVSFLSGLAIVLFGIVGFRWLRSQLLWRLRNRLIVTYVFIGVIPVFLLVMISLITLYLLAGQFASFVVTSEITSHLRSMEASNRAMASELATQLDRGGRPSAETIAGMRSHDADWSRREVCAWHGAALPPSCSGPPGAAAFPFPSFLTGDFREIVRDRSDLYLRATSMVKTGSEPVYVISSEPLDRLLMDEIAAGLGEITLYGTIVAPAPGAAGNTSKPIFSAQNQNKSGVAISVGGQAGVSGDSQQLAPTFTAGAIPPATGAFDREITFGTPLAVIDWASGERHRAGALVRVQTRPSVLYDRLFAALGDLARGVEYILLVVAIFFWIIELLALFIGTRLTRSITAAVAQLYEATKHINRADFSHRIEVKSSDQLATLANSFNSMTTSIEKLILEQKEKQRLENELAIAQEVQAQLYPRLISQLESLEVHGFCRPARTVSGDYYDFLSLNSDKLILAVGDVSGKGISAALLMATIHSAVRAYSLESVPLLREAAAVGAAAGSGLVLASDLRGAEASPGTLLGLLNHQLYESTPQEKYATLFLGIYDGAARQLTYTNGGHLPPILLSEDGSSQLLSCGGTVVGLFPDVHYPEATAQLRRGDIFLAYSDGVTEPENDYGEFGEERLIELVRENRHLPLARITEIVTAAVDDWIGDKEQPDDVTLVLARAR
ncbi:MAG: PP2C family protein-serine/threonine phosphatase [Acidobacteriales bacterium]|nr:PP2C family protein-serine/threonine phosphatase [Terriglobales bacterium]